MHQIPVHSSVHTVQIYLWEKAIKVKIPDNISPGDKFKIINIDGYSFNFVCPDDVFSGQEILVKDPYRVPKSYIAFEPAVLRAIQKMIMILLNKLDAVLKP